jgi:tRNA (guanine-N7-)-methyltransferase
VATKSIPNLIEPPDGPHPLNLHALYGRQAPLVVDLGCGKGRFLAARALRNPEWDFLGTDLQLVRVRKSAGKLHRQGVANARLLRADNRRVLEILLPPASVHACYLFFPDPWPKRRHHKRRQFGPDFPDALHRVLAPRGVFQTATDHADYFAVMRKLLDGDPRFDPAEPDVPADEERTEFEALFLGQGLPIARGAWRRR